MKSSPPPSRALPLSDALGYTQLAWGQEECGRSRRLRRPRFWLADFVPWISQEGRGPPVSPVSYSGKSGLNSRCFEAMLI